MNLENTRLAILFTLPLFLLAVAYYDTGVCYALGINGWTECYNRLVFVEPQPCLIHAFVALALVALTLIFECVMPPYQ